MARAAAIGMSMMLGLTVTCSDQVMTPENTLDETPRGLQPAIAGETGVFIKINGQNLTDPALASRLRVDLVIESGRPTFVGDPNSKKIRISPTHVQASTVQPCMPGFFCETNVIYHDSFGSVPTLQPNEGILGDGDYIVKLFRDGSTFVGSDTIAVNHASLGGPGDNNGTFLNEANDQIVTFFLNQNLQQISPPTVKDAHTRASTHDRVDHQSIRK